MRYFISLFVSIVMFLPIPVSSVFSFDEQYYHQVLRFGTDSDIARAFTLVSRDLGDEINTEVLKSFQEKHSLDVRKALVKYIATSEMGEAEEVLIEELEEGINDEDYKEDCILALGKLKKASSIPCLRSCYFNKESTQRIKKAIIEAWGDIGDLSIEDSLMSIAADSGEDSEVRGRAIIALGKVKSVRSLELLEKFARNRYENRHLRKYAVYSLGEVGGESVLEILGELVEDNSHEVAEYAVRSISHIASAKGGVYLMRALRSDFDKVRYYAVIGLRELHYQDAVQMLAFKAEYDTNETVRREARKALELLEDD